MKKNTLQLLGGLSVALLGSSLVLACGDGEVDLGNDGGAGGDGSGGQSTGSGGTNPGSGGTTNPGSGGDGGESPIDPTLPQVLPLVTTLLDNAINPYGLLFASDGKLYVSGTTDTGAVGDAQVNANLRLAVWRLNADGSLDTTWGDGGRAIADSTLNAGSQTFENPGTSYDIVELADHSFVVQASGSAGVALVKLSATGDFGAPVFVEAGWSAADRTALATLATAAQAACADPEDEEEIAACAAATSAAVAVWPSLTAPAFAQRPGVLSSWGIALDSSGATDKIVVFLAGPAARGTQRTDADRYITRVNAVDLSFDTSFNDGAPFTLDVNGAGLGNNSRRGIVLADGSIVSTGYSPYPSTGNHVELIKLLPTGKPAPAFSFSSSAPGTVYPATPGLAFFNPFEGGFAEAYGAVALSSGTLVTTGYGVSNFDTQTSENDLVSFGVLDDGLDPSFGGNEQDNPALFGAYAVQSEGDPNAGFGVRPYRENGRDLVVLGDDRTVHVGCYDDAAAIFVLTPEGKLDTNVGNGTGRLQYSYPSPFFKAAVSADGQLVAASATSRAKAPTANPPTNSKALLVVAQVTDGEGE